MGKQIVEWIKSLSTVKLLLLCLFGLIFLDMILYYISIIAGRTPSPYPILYEIINLLKEIRVTPAGAIN